MSPLLYNHIFLQRTPAEQAQMRKILAGNRSVALKQESKEILLALEKAAELSAKWVSRTAANMKKVQTESAQISGAWA